MPGAGINQSTHFWQYVSDVVEEFPDFLKDNHAEELMALLAPYLGPGRPEGDCMTPQDIEIAVIGGGLGGAALGHFATAAGLEAHVFERTARFQPLGAGIHVTPNVGRLLKRGGCSTGCRPGAALRCLPQPRRAERGRAVCTPWPMPVATPIVPSI